MKKVGISNHIMVIIILEPRLDAHPISLASISGKRKERNERERKKTSKHYWLRVDNWRAIIGKSKQFPPQNDHLFLRYFPPEGKGKEVVSI